MIYPSQRLATMIDKPEESSAIDIAWAATIAAAAVALVDGPGIPSQTPAQHDAVAVLMAAIFA